MKLKLLLSLLPISLFAQLQAPSDLHLQARSSQSVLISWRDNSDSESGFKIYRDDILIHTTKTNVESFIDTGLEADTSYTYTVMATDDGIADKSKTIYLTSAYQVPEDALFLDIRNDWERSHYGGYPEGSIIATYELREEPAAGESEDRSKRHLNEDFIQEVLNLTGNDKNHHIVIICATGGRTGAYGDTHAPSTSKLLKDNGFTYVEDIYAGIWNPNGWLENNLPWVSE
jgi:rhodanese-related sulfurtransferase